VILVDTSVWVDHFRRDNRAFARLLENGRVLTHAFVIGELTCGNLKRRAAILQYLSQLHAVRTAGQDEVLALIEERRLYGAGLGWVDMHLLASALIDGAQLWSLDKPLAQVARRIGAGVAQSELPS
jgi:hypothetical protein